MSCDVVDVSNKETRHHKDKSTHAVEQRRVTCCAQVCLNTGWFAQAVINNIMGHSFSDYNTHFKPYLNELCNNIFRSTIVCYLMKRRESAVTTLDRIYSDWKAMSKLNMSWLSLRSQVYISMRKQLVHVCVKTSFAWSRINMASELITVIDCVRGHYSIGKIGLIHLLFWFATELTMLGYAIG